MWVIKKLLHPAAGTASQPVAGLGSRNKARLRLGTPNHALSCTRAPELLDTEIGVRQVATGLLRPALARGEALKQSGTPPPLAAGRQRSEGA
jgi:hypothetical protein